LEPMYEVAQRLINDLARIVPDNEGRLAVSGSRFSLENGIDELQKIVVLLNSSLDDEREVARKALFSSGKPYRASTLGREVIEKLVELAVIREGGYQVLTQLDWALHHIVHDKPGWVKEWIESAGTDENAPEMMILGKIYHQEANVLKEMLSAFPHASSLAQRNCF